LPTALICNEGQGKTKSLEQTLTNLYGWNISSSIFSGFLPPVVDEEEKEYDLHFIIFSKKLSAQTCKELHEVRKQMPFSFIIYYYRCLVNSQFLLLAELEVNSCIIGIHRKNYLRELLPHLWLTHWKRIPEAIYPADSSYYLHGQKRYYPTLKIILLIILTCIHLLIICISQRVISGQNSDTILVSTSEILNSG
jgi:hypothetical protein